MSKRSGIVTRKILLSSVAAGLALSGCSTGIKREEHEKTQAQINDLQASIASMTKRLEAMDNQLSGLNDALIATRHRLESSSSSASSSTPLAGVLPHPSAKAGTEVDPESAPLDPEAGFVNDSATRAYKQGLVFLQSRSYSEAILAFSSFLERYADHPLAGSAQYYIGESYFQQKEYKLAAQELERVLTSYDRSPHVPQALRLLAEVEETLGRTDSATKHRQLLATVFPQSPAAAQPQPAAISGAVDQMPEAEASAEASISSEAQDGPPPTAPEPDAHEAGE